MWKSISGWGTSRGKGPEGTCAWSVWKTPRKPAGLSRRGGKREARSGVRKGHCKDLGVNSAVGSCCTVRGRKVTSSELHFKRIALAALLGIDHDGTRGAETREAHCRNTGKKRLTFSALSWRFFQEQENAAVSQETTPLFSSAYHWLQQPQKPCATEKMGPRGRNGHFPLCESRQLFQGPCESAGLKPQSFLPFLNRQMMDGWEEERRNSHWPLCWHLSISSLQIQMTK